MEFWLSRSLFHELFSRWNSSYHGTFLTNIFLFSRWNSGYHKAFFTNFFHDGILAITKPFSRTFFSRWNSGYHEAFFTNFFHDGILAITKPFSQTFFSRWNSGNTRFGGRLFLYIYITKSIYIGSTSLKTLPLDLEPPLQGKEYGPSYSNATRKRKVDFFSRNYL
jgi:hypothetical protein